MGICRILLSPCGFGLLSEKCFAAGFVLPRISLGSLRSAISPPRQNEMAWAGAGWRGKRELSDTRSRIGTARLPHPSVSGGIVEPAFGELKRNPKLLHYRHWGIPFVELERFP